MIRARDYEAALAIANDTEFGLSAGIGTTPETCLAFQAPRAGPNGDGQLPPAWCGLSRALWRPEGIQLWPQGTGPLCRGVLYEGEDRLHVAVRIIVVMPGIGERKRRRPSDGYARP